MSRPDTRIPRPLPASCLAALLFLPAAAGADTPARESAAAITSRIEARDCAGAVEMLKTGLKAGHAEVALLAGSMYENGVCVQRSWQRAIPFYSQAYDSGLPEAASRLAAGFAAPENGPDVAAALWWASRGRGNAKGVQANAGCTVSPAAADDVDRFVAELQTWPQSRLQVCNYIAGVMSTLSAEVKFPELALRYAVGGEVVVRFQPAIPRIDIRRGQSREYQPLGIINGDDLRDRSTRRVTGSFEQVLGEVAERALHRYPQPSGIPAGTEVLVQYVFGIEWSH